MRFAVARLRSHVTYANVVCTLLLIAAVASGGVAVAASLAKNSVGSPQIRAGAVKKTELALGAVDSSRVRNNRLTGADIKESTLRGVPSADRAGNILVAAVTAEGDLVGDRSHGAVSSRSTGVATYNVEFNRRLQGCALVGVAGRGSASEFPMVFVQAQQTGASEMAFVRTYLAPHATLQAAPFTVTAIC